MEGPAPALPVVPGQRQRVSVRHSVRNCAGRIRGWHSCEGLAVVIGAAV